MPIKLALIGIFALFLTSCQTVKTMKAYYSSEVDPDFSFTPDKSIVVLFSEQNNQLETKFYVDHVVAALKERGFRNVYSYRNINEAAHPIDISMIINVGKKFHNYQYEGANYGPVDSGTSITNCTDYGSSINCTQNRQKTFGITGYSNKTRLITLYYFSANWFNVSNEQKIMFTFSSSPEEGCSDRAMYEFLVSETVKRLDFEKPNKYDYSIQMPETYSCNY